MQSRHTSDDDFVVQDDEEETADESDNGFEPIREVGKSHPVTKRQLGPPITIDEKMDSLNPIHRDVVEEFFTHAKEESKKVGAWTLADARGRSVLTVPDRCAAWSPFTAVHGYFTERDGHQFSNE